MSNLQQSRDTLQAVMSFIGALAAGIEDSIGDPSKAMAYYAGKSLGERFSAEIEPTGNLEEALERVREALVQNQCLWHFELFKRKSRKDIMIIHDENKQNAVDQNIDCEIGDLEVELVFRDCMIRQSLFCFGHKQGMSLCTLMYGFFTGALEAIMGCKSRLDILHAGENACLKRLVIRKG